MKTMKWILLVAFLGLALAQVAPALEIGPFCAEFENKSTDWTQTKSVPKFDPNLGTLIAVRATGEACGYQTFAIDSEDSDTQTFEVRTSADIITHMPVGEDFIVHLPPGGGERFRTGTLEPDELNENPDPDFLGPDSYRDFIFDCDSDEKIYNSPAELAAWIGPGNQEIKTTADATTIEHSSGAFDSRIRTSAVATICIYYQYIPSLSISGRKTNYCTHEGILNWEITLIKPDGETVRTKTDINGDYSFSGLAPGDYKVCEETRGGWIPKDPICREVALVDEDIEGIDFQNEPLFCISGHKFNSNTGAGIPGWWITLTDANGAKIRKQTGTGGYYEFCKLASGEYTVSEELKAGWKPIGPTSIPVILDCANSEDNDFENKPITLPCVCPFFIKNDLYTASCKEVKEVRADKGILANDPAGSVVLNPESITIDPKYGTIEVFEDGSFVYDPTVATGRIYSGTYVIFKYNANNGFCDSRYPGIAKIQIRC